MSRKFIIVGNCQSNTLSDFLLSNHTFNDNFTYIKIKNIHSMDTVELDDLYQNILPTLDLIIIQPISDNYKNNNKYGTKSILSAVQKSCIKILFPSLYFDLYHPFMIYIYDSKNPGWKLGTPYDYHDKNILFHYLDENRCMTHINNYRKVLFDENIMSVDELNEIFDRNIKNLVERENKYKNYVVENTIILKSSTFITNNYKKNLLFYSINHPTKFMFYYIANSILISLKIELEQYPDEIDPLKALVIPLYSCIQKIVDFDISEYQNFKHFDIILNDNDIINKYIKAYDGTSKSILQESKLKN